MVRPKAASTRRAFLLWHAHASGAEAGTLSASESTLVASAWGFAANGTTEATVTWTARDASADALPNLTGTVTVEQTAVSASESVVTASPGTVANDGLTSSYVTLTVLDALGEPLPGIPASSCVLAVSGTGNTVTQPTGFTDAAGQIVGSVVSTVAATKTASFTVCGLAITDTASVIVSGTEVAADVEDTFATYTNTANFVTDPLSLYDDVESVLTGTYANVELDTTVGYGTRTQSMKIAYLDATAEGGSGTTGRCTNANHGAWRCVDFAGAITEVWFEVYVRFSADFACGGGTDWGCTSAAELKWFLVGVTGGTSRFNLEATDTQWVWGYPDNETAYVSTAAPQPQSLFDAGWHQIRFQMKVSSGLGVADGTAKWWLDGTLRGDLTSLVIDRTDIANIRLGGSRNQGAATDMGFWMGGWKAWYNANDPGWV